MAFGGWRVEDFEIFTVPGFEQRMKLIRAHIQPRLQALGNDLVPRLEAETGTEWFHHVAKHMRRSVHPPSDTWVAFNRSKKGYKATVHFDLGLSARGANACVVVKPECTERDTFADSMERNAEALAGLYHQCDGLFVGDVPNAPTAALLPASEAHPEEWRDRAGFIRRRKQYEFEAGFRWAPDTAAALSGESFLEEALAKIRALMPLYRGGVERGYTL